MSSTSSMTFSYVSHSNSACVVRKLAAAVSILFRTASRSPESAGFDGGTAAKTKSVHPSTIATIDTKKIDTKMREKRFIRTFHLEAPAMRLLPLGQNLVTLYLPSAV